MANSITLARIFLAFVTLALYQMSLPFRVAALVLTFVVIYLDAVDGWIARKLGVASDFGALFDITGDRIVEHVYWIYFAVAGIVSFWVPLIFVTRSFLVDTLRSVAYARGGRTPFGEKSMARSPLTRFLTASRTSRGIYGVAKAIVFLLLGSILVHRSAHGTPFDVVPDAATARIVLVTAVVTWVVVAMNLVRGVPVIVDGWAYLVEQYYPKEIRREG